MNQAPENSIHPNTRAEWRAWLEANHARSEGVWLIYYKKATNKPRVAYDEAVEEALCFGWIDSKPNKLDDERSMLWFAPRKAGSGWSRPNKERVERMTNAFPRSVKRGILEWIVSARKPETRAKRVEETARLAAQNVRANQWRA